MGQRGIGGSSNSLVIYGVTICERIQTADLDTLMAYHTVAGDLLASGGHGDDGELRASLGDLQKAIAAKQPKA